MFLTAELWERISSLRRCVELDQLVGYVCFEQLIGSALKVRLWTPNYNSKLNNV